MYLIHRACRLSQVGASSSSSAGRLSCLIIRPSRRHRQVDLVVHHPCHHCCPWAICPAGASLSIPHVVVIHVVHGPVVLWRPCPHCYLVGLIVCPPHCCHRRPHPLLLSLSGGGHVVHPPPLSSSSLSSGASLSVPHIIIVSCPPHRRRRHPQAI